MLRREREYIYSKITISILGLANRGGGALAKLPSTIYKQIKDRQRKLYKDGTRNGTISLADCHAIFAAAGYKESTANKWLLNWAVSRVLMFEKDIKTGFYCVRLGEFYDKTPSECLDNGKVWLPVKEVKIKVTDSYGEKQISYGNDPTKAQGWLF